MAVDFFPAKDEIKKQVTDLIYKNHPDLVVIVDEILVMFRDTAPKENGIDIPFQVRKAPPVIHGMPEIKVKYAFFMILSGDMWESAMSFDQEAWLDSALCAMEAAEDPETGETKTKFRKPDVWGYRDAVDRHGNRALFPPAKGDQERQDAKSIVAILKGSDDGALDTIDAILDDASI